MPLIHPESNVDSSPGQSGTSDLGTQEPPNGSIPYGAILNQNIRGWVWDTILYLGKNPQDCSAVDQEPWETDDFCVPKSPPPGVKLF